MNISSFRNIDPLMERIQRMKEKYPAAAEQEYECQICKDTEMVLYTIDGIEYAKPCECQSRKRAKRLMAASGISEEDQSKGFCDFRTFEEKSLEEARNTAIMYYRMFLKNQGQRVNSIILCGASGRGKTTLGLCICNNLIKNNIEVKYMPYRQEITALKQVVTDDFNYNNRINVYKNASVLFIDDFLKGKITESDINIMYEIINHRYLARLPIVLTTERTIGEMMEIDEATASRLVEMSKDYIVTFGVEIQNYRLR